MLPGPLWGDNGRTTQRHEHQVGRPVHCCNDAGNVLSALSPHLTSPQRLALCLQQAARRIFFKPSRLFYIAMHGAVVAPAALALDGLEIGAGAVRAGGHAAAQAVAGQVRHVIEARQPGAAFEYRVDAARMQPFQAHVPPLIHGAQ